MSKRRTTPSCFWFERHGDCRFSESCKFSHDFESKVKRFDSFVPRAQETAIDNESHSQQSVFDRLTGTPPRRPTNKRLPPLFSEQQERDCFITDGATKPEINFVRGNFQKSEYISIALISDSIGTGVVANGMKTFALPGGKIEDAEKTLISSDALITYSYFILFIGVNNLYKFL